MQRQLFLLELAHPRVRCVPYRDKNDPAPPVVDDLFRTLLRCAEGPMPLAMKLVSCSSLLPNILFYFNKTKPEVSFFRHLFKIVEPSEYFSVPGKIETQLAPTNEEVLSFHGIQRFHKLAQTAHKSYEPEDSWSIAIDKFLELIFEGATSDASASLSQVVSV